MDQQFSIDVREQFGLDFKLLQLDPGLFGDLILWIRGEPIGRNDDPVSVYSLLITFEGLLREDDDSEFSLRLIEADTLGAWSALRAGGERYKMPPIEFFDDYIMYAIRSGGAIRFLWVHVNDDQDQPKDAMLPSEPVEAAVREFRHLYDDLRESNRNEQD